MKKHSLQYVLLLLASLFVFSACESSGVDPVEEDEQGRGSIVRAELNASFSTAIIQGTIQLLAQAAGGTAPDDIQPLYDVQEYRIEYLTVDHNGEYAVASGSLLLPVRTDASPMLSYHHGTILKRTSVSTENPANFAATLIAASQGYITAAPDLLGLGISTMIHPYILEEPSAAATVDFLKAAKQYIDENSRSWNGQLFLAGYSEGGFVTMAAMKELEANYASDFPLTAVVAGAGPYDVTYTSEYLLSLESYDNPGYFGYVITAYTQQYGWEYYDDIFNEPYASRIPTLFDGSISMADATAQLTSNITELIRRDFVEAYFNGEYTALTNAFSENSLLDFVPKAPVQLYHGTDDVTVPIENAYRAKDAYFENGATNVTLFEVQGGNHGTSIFPTIEGALVWFNSLRTDSSPARLAVN